jgi:hypothetical protein
LIRQGTAISASRVEKGRAIVSDSIGTGVDWDEDAVHRFVACRHVAAYERQALLLQNS